MSSLPVPNISVFMLDPHSLNEVGVKTEPVELTVTDEADDYDMSRAHGAWIDVWLNQLVRFYNNSTGESVSLADSHGHLDMLTFVNLFPVADVRDSLIRFTNANYINWRDNFISVPELCCVEEDQVQSFCDSCDGEGVWVDEWDETSRPIDPTLFDEHETVPPGASLELRMEIGRRNDALDNELMAAHARWVANRVRVGRENVCQDRCDSYWDACSDAMQERVDYVVNWIDTRWSDFTGGRMQLPVIPRPVHSVIPLPNLEIQVPVYEPLPSMRSVIAQARRMRRGW